MTSAIPLNLERLEAPRVRKLSRLDEGVHAVEQLMLELCSGDRLDRLGTLLWEHVDTGGKRLRARLALAAAEALGGSMHDAIPWAAACELLHNATLVHDDLQDRDVIRRGREALWVRHGEAQAINAGDLGLMLPTLAVRRGRGWSDGLRWKLAEAVAHYAESVVRGQALEMDLLPRQHLDWNHYRAAVVGKTSALFALPVYGAALVAGRSAEEARDLADAFGEIGVLFQVQDDVLDLYGDKGRGVAGSDLREGKVSALVVEHIRTHPEDADWLVELLELDRDATPDEAVQHAIERFRIDALGSVWGRIEAIQDRVSDTPALRREHKLHAVAIDLIARSLTPIVHTHPCPPMGGPT